MNVSSQYVVLIVYGVLLLIMIVFAIAMHLLVTKHKTLKYRMQLDEERIRYAQELLKVKLELQEDAFLKVSSEIHDNIGQVLSSVSLTLQSLKAPPELAPAIDTSANRIIEVTGDLRHLSHMLNGVRVEQLGLIEAIKREITYLRLNRTIYVAFFHPQKSELPELSGSQVLLIFRIAQESIHNVIRHARATTLTVNLKYAADTKMLQMHISDNGIGFLPATDQPIGMGLLSMRERAKLLNGDLSLAKNGMQGSVVSLTVNL